MPEDKYIYVWEEGACTEDKIWYIDKYYVRSAYKIELLVKRCVDVFKHSGVFYLWDYDEDKWIDFKYNRTFWDGVPRIKEKMNNLLGKKYITNSDL